MITPRIISLSMIDAGTAQYSTATATYFHLGVWPYMTHSLLPSENKARVGLGITGYLSSLDQGTLWRATNVLPSSLQRDLSQSLSSIDPPIDLLHLNQSPRIDIFSHPPSLCRI
ncbi:hypothetical protein HJC23_013459 [Cyclotella cryptica]|uniref:Uncharacterized protein n=1 Tax=Cyclotella cryptica TaxID=29204 RepID=A0ABD3NF06_9STRA